MCDVGFIIVLLCVIMQIVSRLFVSFFIVLLFFVKQKTAYEMRISDWSSDVCSSDLALRDFCRNMEGYLLERRKSQAHGQHFPTSMCVVCSVATECRDMSKASTRRAQS